MSTKSMKRNLLVNQKANIVELSRVANNMKAKENKADYTAKQEELAEFTAKTTIIPVDSSVFSKSSKELDAVSIAKSSFKQNSKSPTYKDIRNDLIRIIAKSNPRFNVKLFV